MGNGGWESSEEKHVYRLHTRDFNNHGHESSIRVSFPAIDEKNSRIPAYVCGA